MIATTFPEANKQYGPPPGLEEPQCMTIPAFEHQVLGGSCDGLKQVVVAWKPTDEEIELIKQGKPIFISMMGGLAAHYPSLNFYDATHPS